MGYNGRLSLKILKKSVKVQNLLYPLLRGQPLNCSDSTRLLRGSSMGECYAFCGDEVLLMSHICPHSPPAKAYKKPPELRLTAAIFLLFIEKLWHYQNVKLLLSNAQFKEQNRKGIPLVK